MTKEDQELKKQSLVKNLANSRTELELITGAKEAQIKRNALAKKLLEVRTKMHEQAMKNYRYVAPTYAFQTEAEYIALQKEMSQIEFELDHDARTSKLLEGERNIERYDEQLDSLVKGIADLEQKISEIGE